MMMMPLQTLIEAAGTTLWLVSTAFALSVPIALTAYLLAVSAPARSPVRNIIRAWSAVLTGTPLLLQLFFVYYGTGVYVDMLEALGLWAVLRSPENCVIGVLACNSAAYQFQVLSTARMQLDRGLTDGAAALGLTPLQCERAVLLPIVVRRSAHAIGEEVVALVKGSAVVSVVAVHDLMGAARIGYAQTFDPMPIWLAAGVYLVIVLFVSDLCRRAARCAAMY